MVSTKNKTKYTSNVSQVREFAGTRETTLRISRNSNTKQIDANEVHKILTGIQKGSPSDTQFMVRAMNGQRFFTFKTFKSDEMMSIQDFEEYYQNSVKDINKFEKFAFIEITSLSKITKHDKIKKVKKI